MELIIAIDGYSSCGKSTLAKQLAKQLGYTFIDTGAMYRAITLYFLRDNVIFSNEASVLAALERTQLHFGINEETGQSEVFLNGENVARPIRDMIISEK